MLSLDADGISNMLETNDMVHNWEFVSYGLDKMFTGDHQFFIMNNYHTLDVTVMGMPRQHLDTMLTPAFAAESYWQPDDGGYTKEQVFEMMSDINSTYLRAEDPLSVTNE